MLFTTTVRTRKGPQEFFFLSQAHTREGLERSMGAQFAEFRETYPEAERPNLCDFTFGRYEDGRHVTKALQFDDFGGVWL